MSKYVYPAIFTPEEDGKYSVVFPDLSGCYTSGDNLTDAMYMAEDVLAFTLYSYEKRKQNIPTPSDITVIFDYPENAFVNYIVCDTIEMQVLTSLRYLQETLKTKLGVY